MTAYRRYTSGDPGFRSSLFACSPVKFGSIALAWVLPSSLQEPRATALVLILVPLLVVHAVACQPGWRSAWCYGGFRCLLRLLVFCWGEFIEIILFLLSLLRYVKVQQSRPVENECSRYNTPGFSRVSFSDPANQEFDRAELGRHGSVISSVCVFFSVIKPWIRQNFEIRALAWASWKANDSIQQSRGACAN